MSSTTHTQPDASSRPARRGAGARLLLAIATHAFNPLAARFAGGRAVPIFALLRHRGRRSGRAFVTPVAARPYPGGFIIPLTFGVEADWYQNIEAAGGGGVRWKGVEHALVAPEVVEFAEGKAAFSPVERALLPLFRIKRFARLRDAPAAS